MFGPTGGGALWVRGELLAELPPFLGGGEMINRVTFARTEYARAPHRFEAGTPAIGAAIGMGAAARFLASLDRPAATRHELALTERLLDGLAKFRRPGDRARGLQGRIGVVSFEAEARIRTTSAICWARAACLRGGHHCAQPLMDRFGVVATARASLALQRRRRHRRAAGPGRGARHPAMSDELYHQAILELAKKARQAGRLDAPQASVTLDNRCAAIA